MIDDELLRQVLKQKVINIKEYPRSVQKKVESEMANKYNVKFGDTVDIFNGISPNSVDELSYDMLYKFMMSIHEVAINSDLKIDASDLYAPKYFTQQEIVEFSVPYSEENKDADLVITDWKQKSPTLYKIYTNIDEVIKWRNYNKLRFNPETQRDLITVIVNGKKINKLDINRDSVNEIKTLMKKDMYFNVTGTININPDLFNDYLPYKVGKNLIIPKEAHMDLIEGFHNYLAETEVKDELPDWEYDIEFDLRLMDIDESNRFILQMNKKNHFKESQVVRIDKLNEINYIIDTLNKRTSFHLYGTIDNDTKVYLNKLIKKIYGNVNEREQAINILENIESVSNNIIEVSKHFNKPFNKKEWFSFIILAKFLADNKRDLNLNKFDLDKYLNSISTSELTSKNIKNIYKILKEVM